MPKEAGETEEGPSYKPEKQPTPEQTPDPEPRSPTHPGPDVEAGGDAVPQVGGGERLADLYIFLRKSYVNISHLCVIFARCKRNFLAFHDRSTYAHICLRDL